MAKGFTEDQRRAIFHLAQSVRALPKSARRVFLESSDTDPALAREALQLADRLESADGGSQWHTGETVGRFQLKDYLGSGGAGEVYAAFDPELGRTVAMKRLRSDAHQLRNAQEQSINELIAASALNHPNIVTVHEIFRTDSEIAIVLELVTGVPLRQLFGEARPLTEVLQIGQQIAGALAAAHAVGITHGNLKPENVMLRADGQVKVLDFGLARLGGAELGHQASARSNGQSATAPDDVFALGVILYELSTGCHPFSANSPSEDLQANSAQPPDRPSAKNTAIPALLDSTIGAMLQPDPAERPSAASVAGALCDCERQVRTRSSATPTSRRRLLTWKWAVGVIVLLISAAALFWRSLAPRSGLRDLEQVTTLIPDNRATAAAISGDGTIISFANADGVFIRVLSSGETTLLKGPQDFIVDYLAWLPDGVRVVASGFHEETNQPAIWLLSVIGEPTRELRKDARFGTPSPDGSRIAFLSGDYASVWTMSADGQEATRLIDGADQDSFLTLLWSPDSRHLLFQRLHYAGEKEHNFLWLDENDKPSFDVADVRTGKIVAQKPGVWVRSGVALPSGEILFLSGETSRNDYLTRLWTMNIDLATGKLLPNVRRVDEASFGALHGLALTATKKGDKIAFIRQQIRESVFVAEFQKAALRFSNFRRLTLDNSASYPHSWTADSKAVIFESNRNGGGYDLFSQKVDQRVPEPLVTSPKRLEILPQLSPEGKFVLYAAGPANGGVHPLTLMRVPVSGGPLAQVPLPGPLEEFRCSPHPQGRCVIRKSIGQAELVYSELDPGRGVGQELARTSWLQTLMADWDISPDGRFVVIPNHDARSARIRVLRLGEGQGPKERELEIPGLNRLSVVSWAADGSGWFVSADTTIGRRMHFLDPHGHLNSLGTIQGWAVPAPDGKKVAFLNNITDANVWTAAR